MFNVVMFNVVWHKIYNQGQQRCNVLIYRKEKTLSTPHVGGKELQLAAF